jgi:hypothetical protein
LDKQMNYLEKTRTDLLIRDSLSEFMKAALIVDNTFIEELKYLFLNASLKHCFIIDSLLLIHSEEKAPAKQIELLTVFLEVLGITNKEAETLTLLANAIIKQDSKLSEKIYYDMPDSIAQWSFHYYLTPFAKHPLVFMDENQTIYHSVEKKPYKFDIDKKELVISNKEITLSNLIIAIGHHYLRLNECKKVLIENCNFSGEDNTIVLTNIEQVTIRNCNFKNFSDRVFIIDDCKKALLSNCTFEDCGYTYEDLKQYKGGVIKGQDSNLVIEQSNFKNCYIKNYTKFEINTNELLYKYKPYYAIANIIDGNIQVSNSNFETCWVYARNELQKSLDKALDADWPSSWGPRSKEKTYDGLYRVDNGLFPKGNTSIKNCSTNDSASILDPQ